jgi:hypothetical protein
LLRTNISAAGLLEPQVSQLALRISAGAILPILRKVATYNFYG